MIKLTINFKNTNKTLRTQLTQKLYDFFSQIFIRITREISSKRVQGKIKLLLLRRICKMNEISVFDLLQFWIAKSKVFRFLLP